jgi:tRNA (mo5U34)-methyltransferase
MLGRSRRIKLPGFELAITVDERYSRAIGAGYRRITEPFRKENRQPAQKEVSSGSGYSSTQSVKISAEVQTILDRVNKVTWYHVLDLPCGLATPGRADHRRQRDLYGLPEDMRGMTALDVATFDGFWAFEMERRGAKVTAVDIGRWSQADVPLRWLERLDPADDRITGDGFRLAKELLRSNVERKESSVYDLDPKELGEFDVVFLSDLLLHIRDPLRALEKIWTVVAKPHGYAIIAEPYSPELEQYQGGLMQYIGYDKFVWQIPSTTTLQTMITRAGFDAVELGRFRLDYQNPFPIEKVVYKATPRDYSDPNTPAP